MAKGTLPNTPGSMAITIPTGMENTQHHFGHGVCPLAKALICVISRTAKNIQNSKNAGRRKYAAYCKTGASPACFVRNTRAQVGTWKPHAPNIRYPNMPAR